MKRKQAIAVIVADVAQHGIAGKAALRAFVENRISRAAFNEAVAHGLHLYNVRRQVFQEAAGGFWCKPLSA